VDDVIEDLPITSTNIEEVETKLQDENDDNGKRYRKKLVSFI
jgi:hypothetical protein